MSLLNETKRILRTYEITPRKRLGQNFLVDDETLLKMLAYASLTRDDVVLEIGAGLGFLTERLADKAKHVFAVEIDHSLVRILKSQVGTRKNVTILEGDILKIAVPAFNKVVSAPPYSISSPLLFWLLDRKFKEAVLTFQEEFAKRLAASVGSEDYGRLTVTTYYRAEVELLDPIPRELFWPPPDVDSMIVQLRPKKPPFYVENEELFFDVVRALFTQKNKKLRNAIMPFFGRLRIPKEKALEMAESLSFHNSRPRELTPEEIGLTVNELAKKLQLSEIY